MTIAAGTKLGRYEIRSKIGAGGMGEVYQTRDMDLGRERAFHGESAGETMSAILKEDPPELSDTNKTVSPSLERLVNHCL